MVLVQRELKNAYIGEYKLITTSGIYHNATLGLISLSSNGSNWITIADKNLGATTVWNYGDTINDANAGKVFQRGRNYAFPYSNPGYITTRRVDASGYGPGNYYTGNKYFITYGGDWSIVRNDNLWGDTTNTSSARQGPCDSGFHVPSKTELDDLMNLGQSLGAWSIGMSLGTQDIINITTYLHLPLSGYLDRDSGSHTYGGTRCLLWSSSPSSIHGSGYRIVDSGIYTSDGVRADGRAVRPFANTPTQPDSSRTKLY